ncbi:MAG: lysine biosynthesis protein LysX [Candidatus Micrarchaeota archaeon]|nr:lysine biosynthesis protein LysX [Candidatus Micrarchaeota archaeon]
MKIGICYTVVSEENKMIFEAAKKEGIALERIVDGEAVLPIANAIGKKEAELDVLLQRSVSYSRGLYLAYYYEKQGTQVINSYHAAKIFGDKALCSIELAASGIPTPRTSVSFSPEAATESAEEMGFPIVIKPVMGSWARMVHRINDSDALDMVLESREEMGNPWQKIYYVQEHVNKPGRDIRAFVVGGEVIAAMYRNATDKSGWVTNAAKGATTTQCPVTPELAEICLKAARIGGEGIYGVDLMESERGLLVHEVNHTAEFKSCAAATGVDIAGKIVDYAIARAKG